MPSSTSPLTTLDQWSALCHKAGLDFDRPNASGWSPPSWLPVDARRRLTAYRVLAAYVSNVAREVLAVTGTTGAEADRIRREHREFGDPAVMVSRIVAGLVGSEPALAVAEAASPPPLRPELPDPPSDPGEGADPIERRIYERQRAVYEAAVVEALDAWEADWSAWPSRRAAHEWLDAWQTAERYSAKIYESELRNTVPLGDGVLVLDKLDGGRYSLTVLEPDAYHPVLDDGAVVEFPDIVHLAWEFEDENPDGTVRRMVRRITYELVDVADVGRDPYPVPWRDEPETRTCLLTNRVWTLRDDAQWSELGDDAGIPEQIVVDGEVIELVDHDLRIPWIPVLHVPNTPDTSGHFGRSSIANVVQLFDSIASNDTDLERASALAGTPMLGLDSETPPSDMRVKPGAILQGKLTPLDLSASADALLRVAESLLDRLSVNSEVPAVALGRSETTASGISIALQFAPFDALIGMLRLTRRAKYPMLGRWALRWAALSGDLPDDIELRHVTVEPVFPDSAVRDLSAIVAWVVSLLTAHGISTSTALVILRNAGIPIDDIAAELDRIRSEDTEAAVNIASATRDDNAARQWLGLGELPTEDPGDPAFGAS